MKRVLLTATMAIAGTVLFAQDVKKTKENRKELERKANERGTKEEEVSGRGEKWEESLKKGEYRGKK